jgi:hypothetical protein
VVILILALGAAGQTLTAPTSTAACADQTNNPDGPFCYSHSLDTPPAEGSWYADINFTHSSSGGFCNSTGTCIKRITGPSLSNYLITNYPTKFPQLISGSLGFVTASGTGENTVSVDGTHFIITAQPGTLDFVMDYNFTTGVASFNQLVPTTFVKGSSSLHFSKTEPNILYAHQSGGANLAQLDVTDPTHTVTKLYDLIDGSGSLNVGEGCGAPPAAWPYQNSSSFAQGWDSSYDLNSDGKDDFYATFNNNNVVVFKRSTGGCRWWNVVTDTGGSNSKWPGFSCSNCLGAVGRNGGIHAVILGHDGVTIRVADTMDTPYLNQQWNVIWNLNTGAVIHASSADGNGHLAPGYHRIFQGQSPSPGKWNILDALNNPGGALEAQIPRLSGSDQHNMGVGMGVNELGPMYSGNFTSPLDPANPLNVGYNEVDLVKFTFAPYTATTYRFAHMREWACANADPACTTSTVWFYDELSGNVSKDSRIAIMPSNWNGDSSMGTYQANQALQVGSVDAASGGNTVYYLRGGGVYQWNLAGKSVTMAGHTAGANNGTFTIVSNTATTLTVNNPNGVAETYSAAPYPTATYPRDWKRSDVLLVDLQPKTGGAPQAATPYFTPGAGSYGSAQDVTIQSTTSGATLCYTTDGSTPTADGAGACTHGSAYSSAVNVASSLTLKAVASKSGSTDSAAAAGDYVINPAASAPRLGNVPLWPGRLGTQVSQ